MLIIFGMNAQKARSEVGDAESDAAPESQWLDTNQDYSYNLRS